MNKCDGFKIEKDENGRDVVMKGDRPVAGPFNRATTLLQINSPVKGASLIVNLAGDDPFTGHLLKQY